MLPSGPIRVLSSPKFSRKIPMAGSAFPVSIFFNNRVGFRKLVTVDAGSTERVNPSLVGASLKVFKRGYGLEMIGVHTESIFAKMVQLETFGDGTADQLVGKSVSNLVLSANSELSVCAAFCGRPKPATACLYNASPESTHGPFEQLFSLHGLEHMVGNHRSPGDLT